MQRSDHARARQAYGQAAAGEGGDGTGTLPLGLESFAVIFRDWVGAYTTHVYSELAGRTPAQA